MTKITKTTKKQAFSLAETVITLLIIALVALGTVPVLTKKSSSKSTGHGKWMCTLDSSGRHVKWETGDSGDPQDPSTWTSQGSRCTFNVPKGANSFNVVVVGGGGGGAGAGNKNYVYYSDFVVEQYGKYKFAAVGGGGEGGRCNKRNGTATGGGAGGVGFIELNIDSSIRQIKMSKGTGGEGGGMDGNKGNDSVITAVYKSGINKNILTAGGGTGGGGRGQNTNHNNDAVQGSVTSDFKNLISYNTSSGKGIKNCEQDYCGGYIPVNTQRSVNKKMSSYQFFKGIDYARDTDQWTLGRGGGVAIKKDKCDSYENYPRSGNEGNVMAITQVTWSGSGGKAGQIKEKFYYHFKENKITVIVGKGGAGGAASDSNGNNSKGGVTGNPSSFGNYLPASGGRGGETKDQQKAGEQISGGDGAMTPAVSYYDGTPTVGKGGYSSGNSSANGLTGTGFGAGGGGGGVKPGEEPGKGADGAPGAVIVEW